MSFVFIKNYRNLRIKLTTLRIIKQKFYNYSSKALINSSLILEIIKKI